MTQGKKIAAAVVGATGYAGAELVRILWDHPQVELKAVTSRQYAGQAIAQVFPAFQGVVPLVCEEFNAQSIGERADVVFLALPHKLPMAIAPQLEGTNTRIVDLSADFRFNDQAAYEAVYQPHTSPELMKKSVYGLCELYRKEIAQAFIIGNPGCYPTCSLLPLAPFIQQGVISTRGIVIDAKSGASGAGRGLSLTTHYCELTEGFSAYKVAAHRHCPEMEEILSREAGRDVKITFAPHLVPMSRGMLATSYSMLEKDLDTPAALEILREFYKDAEFVKICPDNALPRTSHVRGTNYVHIAARVDEHANRLILVSVIDNLVKGAAGQAVQNMNIMFGLAEGAGLNAAPYPV
ncbi:N-acetyl-gamma-glutamyl-phosphate reductase [Desulfatibacillum aliphaticivorans]|uniref:N-acetyl-gamma-glutamyl-phosphate reductase n=1 Tax=Desulfatibacillum aliphaticivorans TaxID=218208 RepID=B8FIZ1_DESAL|nr:N-acetyl-gamma-glutamyl-phosphate reductase [Desulfatibacillum aliphaticivorans]ACL04382.1 N-acetyl-gamma-glutamyl-phosphate reductase [Desulfatibacillum aliphaticivorans]